MKRKRVYIMMVVLAAVMIIAGCGQTKERPGAAMPPSAETPETGNPPAQSEGAKADQLPIVTMEMEEGGEVKIELYPDIAPNTVANFISLVQDGFYDGLIFHRVIPDFMIQGGDPEGSGMGGPGYHIRGEFAGNGFQNELTHERGVISMARSRPMDSAGSQFFIVVEDSPHLDGSYAAFGKVIAGMETIDRIRNVKTGSADRPVEDQVIKRMTVDTGGKDYGPPEKVK